MATAPVCPLESFSRGFAKPRESAIQRVGISPPRLRGEVGICALFAQIPGEGSSPQALSRKSELVETPPHPDPLHSPSKTGVNALMASGERGQHRRPTRDCPGLARKDRAGIIQKALC